MKQAILNISALNIGLRGPEAARRWRAHGEDQSRLDLCKQNVVRMILGSADKAACTYHRPWPLTSLRTTRSKTAPIVAWMMAFTIPTLR